MTPSMDPRGDSRRADDGFVVLPIKTLKVDRSYQRRYDHAMVLRILAQNNGVYDMVWAGPILVNRRSTGGLYVVDGQHRVGMATEAGESEILAELLVGLTREGEAELRVVRHSRKSDNGLERFHARITAGDKKAIIIRDMVKSHGGEIADSFAAPNGHIKAVRSLERIYDKDPDRLDSALSIIHDSFGKLHRANTTSYMLGALDWMLEAHNYELVKPRLIRRLQNYGGGMRALDSRAKVLSIAGGSMAKNYYRALVEVYNARTPQDERLIPRA